MNWSSLLSAFGLLFVVVMARANATYWIGRGAAAGTRRLRVTEGPTSPSWQRAQRLVHRWGPLAVVLCFLTVGVQTAVNATAGITRMPLRRYLPAVTLGSVIWAAVYASVGLVAARAWLATVARSPAAAAVLVAVVVGVVAVLVRHRTNRPGQPAGGGTPDREDVPTPADDVRS